MKYLIYLLILILGLALIFIGKGLLSPSVSYDSEITVNKSAAESWAVMSDEENLPKWIKGFVRSEQVSGAPNTIGAVSNVYVEENGEEMVMQETIKSFRLNEHMGMKFTMDFMNMDYDMYFEEKDGKTNIRSSSKTVGNGVFAKSMISFMPKSMKAQEDENMQSLKKLIEENTKNYFPEVKLDTAMVNEAIVPSE